jgi:hypothetical protein
MWRKTQVAAAGDIGAGGRYGNESKGTIESHHASESERTFDGRAGATGLEPATSGVTGRRSNQLNYAPKARAV